MENQERTSDLFSSLLQSNGQFSDNYVRDEIILTENCPNKKNKLNLNIYGNNFPTTSKVTPQEVIKNVALTLQSLQKGENVKLNKNVRLNLEKYKKSSLLPLSQLVLAQEPKQKVQAKFETQNFSSTQLVNVIDNAEYLLEFHNEDMTKEFNRSISDIENSVKCSKDSIEPNKLNINSKGDVVYINNNINNLKNINNNVVNDNNTNKTTELVNDTEDFVQDDVLEREICESLINLPEVDFGDGDPYQNICNIENKHTEIHTTEENKILSQDVVCVNEYEINSNDNRTHSPVFNTNVTKSPHLVFSLEIFENFEKQAVTMLQGDEKYSDSSSVSTLHIDQVTPTTCDFISIDKNRSLSIENMLETTPLPVKNNLITLSNTSINDDDKNIQLEVLDTLTVNSKQHIEDNNLFSSDDEYLNIETDELPLTCALETSFYADQSGVLDKNMILNTCASKNCDNMTLSEMIDNKNSNKSVFNNNDNTVTNNIDVQIGFKTASNKNILISTKAQNDVDKIFKDIDLSDSYCVKQSKNDIGEIFNSEFIINNRDKENQPNKYYDIATNKDVTKLFSDDITFEEINLIENELYEGNKLDSKDKNIYDNPVLNKNSNKSVSSMHPFPCCDNNINTGVIGFQTASNKALNISDKALLNTKNIFKDIFEDFNNTGSKTMVTENNLKNQSKPFQIENSIPEGNTTFKIPAPINELNKINDFVAIKTASNKCVKGSEKASKKSEASLSDILNENEVTKLSTYTDNKRNIDVINQCPETSESVKSTLHTGFQTARNKKINISDAAMRKSNNLFHDILDPNDISTEQSASNTVTANETRNKETYPNMKTITNTEFGCKIASNQRVIHDSKDKDENEEKADQQFIGFKTASNKKVKISEESYLKTNSVFQDILESSVSMDIKEQLVVDGLTETLSTCEKGQTKPKPFVGFQTANNKKINICKDALIKSNTIFKDIFDQTVENSNKKDEYTDFKLPYKKKVEISKNAVEKPKSLFLDLLQEEKLCQENKIFEDHIGTKNDINKKNIISKAPFNFTTESNKSIHVSKESISKRKTIFNNEPLDENCFKINDIFGGFQTASNKKVTISKEAIEKTKSLYDDILIEKEDFIKENKETNSNIKTGLFFQTANNKRVKVSENALKHTKTVFNDFDTSEDIFSKNNNIDNDIKTKIDMTKKINIEAKTNYIDTQISKEFEVFNIDTQPDLSNFEQTLHTEDFLKTPVKTKRSGSPIFSCPKAKKRFVVPYSNSQVKEIENEIKVNNINEYKFTENYKKHKVFKLKDLICIEVENNLKNLEIPTIKNTNIDLKNIETTFLNAVNKNIIPNDWIKIHLKQIIWKLKSYELKFPTTMYGVCNEKEILDQLKYRYDKELYNSERSALRKIYERDDASTKTLVLCVQDILVDGISVISIQPKSTNIEFILTDGWYTIRCIADVLLQKQVLVGKIKVGTKLFTHGAELVNCDQGLAPWEDTSKVRLKIFGNSTRLARWDEKLGYSLYPNLPVPLSTIKVEGGKVSMVQVLVIRVYPLLYVEKFSDGSTVTRSERLEQIYQTQYEQQKQDLMEKLYEEIEKEMYDQDSQDSSDITSGNKCKSLDSGSQIAKFIKQMKDPSQITAALSSTQSHLLNEYMNKKREKFAQDIQNKMADKLKNSKFIERNVVTLLKVRVVGFDPGKETFCKGHLSIWRPTDAILDIVKEGEFVNIRNVIPTAVRYSELQLSANRQSVFRKTKKPTIKENIEQFKRKCSKINEINSLRTYEEIDTVGIIIKIEPNYKEYCDKIHNFQNVYLANENKQVMCLNFWGGVTRFGYQNLLEIGSVIYCKNLLNRAGNTRKSLPHFRVTELTTFSRTSPYSDAKMLLDVMQKYSNKTFIEECCAAINKNAKLYESVSAQKMVSPEVLKKKLAAQEKIAKLKLYGEPPPLSPITILNKSYNADAQFRSPVNNIRGPVNTSRGPVNIEHVNSNRIPVHLNNCDPVNTSSNKSSVNINSCVNMSNKSPVNLSKGSVNVIHKIDPVKLNFSMDFEEDFDGSPPLSLD